MRDTERGAETQAEGEAGSCREPDVGLDPRTPGSRPEPKADAQPLSHPGALQVLRIYYAYKCRVLQSLLRDTQGEA